MVGRESKDFNARWYRKRYKDVADSGMDPREHYELFGKAEGRMPSPVPLSRRFAIHLRNFRAFHWLVLRHADGIRAAIRKLVQVAEREGLIEPRFDEDFYLEKYPDVKASGVDPYKHFVCHGRIEGRVGVRQNLTLLSGGRMPRVGRPKILMVSHEASITGAPILSLNIARKLSPEFDIVSLILGAGPLYPSFREESIAVIGPVPRKENAVVVDDLVAQLLEKYSFEFALVNSIECAPVLEPLSRRSVPLVTLIHEFASYTRPRDAFRNAFFWSNEIVFSTKLTYDDAIDLYPDLAGKTCQILPQGQCTPAVFTSMSNEEREKERLRVRTALKPDGGIANELVVVGLGYAHIRKGVEYFVECAAKAKAMLGARKIRFVWVGSGYDPENDMGYSVYIADQIRRSGLQSDIKFIGSTSEIEEVYRTADLLLVTSRLDPLPNVAIDAMQAGLPILCFDGTTGVAEILEGNGLGGTCVSPYLDAHDMANKVHAFAKSPGLKSEVGDKLREIARETFDMSKYITALQMAASSAQEKVAMEREAAGELHKVAGINPHYIGAAGEDVSLDELRWRYLRPWSSGFGTRKPFPGFHPGVFSERHDVREGDPLLAYLKAGRPQGPWQLEVIEKTTPSLPLLSTIKVALQLHVYFPDLLGEIMARLQGNKVRPDLFISVPNDATRKEVVLRLKGYGGNSVVSVVPNRGRDIGPLLTAFRQDLRRYEFVGHLHTKKTLDLAEAEMAQRWRNFLLENLIGGYAPMADIILSKMAANTDIGLVFPDDPNTVGWSKNKSHAEVLSKRMGLKGRLFDQFFFPVGTMFWARSDALSPLFDLGLEWDDYPPEPLPYDGSMLHALERLLPFVVAEQGKRSAVTHVHGITR